jgi:hypothetical protein
MEVLSATFNMRLIAPAWGLVVKAAILIVAVRAQGKEVAR